MHLYSCLSVGVSRGKYFKSRYNKLYPLLASDIMLFISIFVSSRYFVGDTSLYNKSILSPPMVSRTQKGSNFKCR